MRSLIFFTFALLSCQAQQKRLRCTNLNEEWTQCGPRCGQSCADQGKLIACPMLCALAGGCSCKEGYARNSNDQCIPKSQCPKNNGTGSSGCPHGLSRVNCLVDPCMTASCPGVNGAQCNADYCGGCNTKWFLNGRDVTGQCSQNNNACGPDEEYQTCGSACPPQCGDETMGACIAMCKSGCFCKQGLVRGPNNQCIKREECPNNNPSKCALMLCAQGTRCEETPQGSQCVADRPKVTCANVRCAGPCEDTPNGPRCRPRGQNNVCRGNPCGNPCQRCIPERKQCFTTPCPQYRCEQITGCLGPPISANKPGTCPPVAVGTVGTCVEGCSSDPDCQGSQKCCSNGCGHTCQNPIDEQ